MSLSARGSCRSLKIILLFVLSFLAVPVGAQEQVVVAVIGDGPADRFQEFHEKYIDELLTLTANEFDVKVRRFSGEWSKESIDAAIEKAYVDSEVDLVLVTGFVANQIAATRRQYSKPTFLPLILDTRLIAGDAALGQSGVANLNYLSIYADFAEDLDTLARIVPYRNLVVLVDSVLASAILELQDAAYAASAERGIELNVVTHDGVEHRLMNQVPANTDAIFIAGLPRMPLADLDRLIEALHFCHP